MSLVLRLPRKMHLCRSSSKCPTLPSFFEMLQNPHVLLTFEKVHNPVRLPCETTSQRPKVVRNPGVFNILTSNVLRATTACTFSTSQLPKAAPSWCVLYIFTSKCASRHNGVHFFDIAASKHMFNSKCASRNKGVYFFDIATSKNAPRMVCFVHFDLEMCFAPQQHAIFHLSSGQMAPHPPL